MLAHRFNTIFELSRCCRETPCFEPMYATTCACVEGFETVGTDFLLMCSPIRLKGHCGFSIIRSRNACSDCNLNRDDIPNVLPLQPGAFQRFGALVWYGAQSVCPLRATKTGGQFKRSHPAHITIGHQLRSLFVCRASSCLRIHDFSDCHELCFFSSCRECRTGASRRVHSPTLAVNYGSPPLTVNAARRLPASTSVLWLR